MGRNNQISPILSNKEEVKYIIYENVRFFFFVFFSLLKIFPSLFLTFSWHFYFLFSAPGWTRLVAYFFCSLLESGALFIVGGTRLWRCGKETLVAQVVATNGQTEKGENERRWDRFYTWDNYYKRRGVTPTIKHTLSYSLSRYSLFHIQVRISVYQAQVWFCYCVVVYTTTISFCLNCGI